MESRLFLALHESQLPKFSISKVHFALLSNVADFVHDDSCIVQKELQHLFGDNASKKKMSPVISIFWQTS